MQVTLLIKEKSGELVARAYESEQDARDDLSAEKGPNKPSLTTLNIIPTRARTPVESKILEAVVELVDPFTKVKNVHPRHNLELDLEFDSMEKLDLCAAVEDKWDIVIMDEELKNIETVYDLAWVVSEKAD